jgi:hypothetical protein
MEPATRPAAPTKRRRESGVGEGGVLMAGEITPFRGRFDKPHLGQTRPKTTQFERRRLLNAF